MAEEYDMCGCRVRKRTMVMVGVGIAFLAILGLVLGLTLGGSEESQEQAASTNIRLPTSVLPLAYTMRLRPDVHQMTVEGSSDIHISVVEETSEIVLHLVDNHIKEGSMKLKPVGGSDVEDMSLSDYSIDEDKQFLIIRAGSKLATGEYILSLEYNGTLSDGLAGFYRSSYMVGDEQRTIAVTQFEPTDARRAFPCFDEPALKANFTITLGRLKTMTALSNMPLIETEEMEGEDEWVWDHFDTTYRMSTYLVAMAVTDFLNKTNDNSGTLFRVSARESAIDQVDYALEAGPIIQTYYEEFFDIPFPLPKQDMLALPDFSAGAMENWGLITYRETALLYDEDYSSAANEERIAVVVAHELAHQWFGDLVTLSWWTDLWLNEGFAAYTEFLGTEFFSETKFGTGWGMLDKFVVDDLQPVFRLDAMESSHPITVVVNRPEEINQIFDDISYKKGASLLRMLNHSLTEDNFVAGVQAYLKANQYDNAEQDDLWGALTTASEEVLPEGVSVKDIMETWTLQMGYPVVSVAVGDAGVTVSQDRFLMSIGGETGSDQETTPNEFGYKWWIPITYTTSPSPDFNKTAPSHWMSPDESVTIPMNEEEASFNWILVNLQQTAYYRVNYEAENWAALTDQLVREKDVIHRVSRSQLIDDAMSLARAGELDYPTALRINDYLASEFEYIPWKSALNNFLFMEQMLTRSSGYFDLKNYMMKLIAGPYYEIGFSDQPEDSHQTKLLRTLMVSWACQFEIGDCAFNAVAAFEEYMEVGKLVAPNVKSSVYCNGVARGADAEWDFLWEMYRKTDLAQERDTIQGALACTEHVPLLYRYLEMTFNSEYIRKQDAKSVFASISANDIGRDLAWDYLRNNIEYISSYMSGFSALGDMILSVSNEFNTEQKLQELKEFKETKYEFLGSATFSVDQAIEYTESNIAWMDEHYHEVVDWLRDEVSVGLVVDLT